MNATQNAAEINVASIQLALMTVEEFKAYLAQATRRAAKR
jgi:hypothetical protein